MLDQILHEIKNYFVLKKYKGTFTITEGAVELPFLQNEQYFRITGSVFNDGVYQYPTSELHDETFAGEIWAMAIPKEFLDLVTDIEAWQGKYGGIDSYAMSPYSSESFGGYTYSKSISSYGDSATGNANWQSMFRARLNRWRKL